MGRLTDSLSVLMGQEIKDKLHTFHRFSVLKARFSLDLSWIANALTYNENSSCSFHKKRSTNMLLNSLTIDRYEYKSSWFNGF